MEDRIVTEPERHPFYLKRAGRLKEAIAAYAIEYAHGRQSAEEYIRRVCLEQIVDCALLTFVSREQPFASRGALQEELKEVLRGALKEQHAFEPHEFNEEFARVRGKLFPGGRGKSPFSVNPKALVEGYQQHRDEDEA